MVGDRQRFVVDIDAHYFENARGFAQYLSEPWKTRFETWSGRFYTPVAGRTQTVDARVGGRINHRLPGFPETDTRDGVLEFMRYFGIDAAVMLPGSMLTIGHISDRPRAVALCNGYVDYMLGHVADPDAGIYCGVIAPSQSPGEGAALIDRVAHEPGICAVVMMSDGPVLPFGDPYYDPIYDACCRNGLPLILHSGYGGPEAGESGFKLQTYVENHLAFVLNQQIQLTSIVMQGVPERFPSLRIVFQEAGVFWIPQMMFRLDSEYSYRRALVPWLKRTPSEYIKEFYFGSQPLEQVPRMDYLRYVFEMIEGERCLMFATDWPHSDFDHPDVIERLNFLDPAGKRAILGGNARRVLRFRGKGWLDLASGEAAPPEPGQRMEGLGG